MKLALIRFVVGLVISLTCFEISARAATEENRPNVLFIAVDDLRPELGTYGTKVKTPNLDRFARSGTQFDRAYCQQAVCGASRLSIMSGLYPTRTKEQTYHVDKWRERHPDLITMNQHFGASGYATIGLGKIYHGTSGPGVDPENWDRWLKLTAPEYALESSNKALEAFRKQGKVGNAMDPAKGPTTEMADVSDDTYADGQRAIRAAKLIKQMGERSNRSAPIAKPFFMAVGLTKPHLPFVAPKKYWDMYERDQFAMPSNRGIPDGYPKYAANLPAHEMKKYSDYEGEMPTDFSDDLNKRLLHGYAACVSYADANLGMILDALSESGLADNTIVVIWGDHGWKLGDHSTWCKHTNFECDTRVPLLIRAPGHKKDQRCMQPVELIDLYPTLCELSGIKTPSHCQGRSMVPLLNDRNAAFRKTAYSSYPAGKRLVGHSIRFGDLRYTEWRDRENGKKTDKRVLTDLKNDPGETVNVIQDATFAKQLERVEALLDQRVRDAKKE